jgi:hypothetical protein
MNKQLIFIDDSGDPGFKKDSSSYFVMACAIFMDDEVATKVAEEIRMFRKTKGWGVKAEFKFNTTRKEVLKDLLTIVIKYDFRVRAVYLDKKRAKDILMIADRDKLYNYAITELLNKVSPSDALVRIDGRSSKAYMRQAATFIRKEANKSRRRISSVKFEDSVKNDLLQLADVVAGSVHRSLQKDKSDSKDYVKMLKHKIISIDRLDI